MNDNLDRLNQEWIVLSATRGLIKIASKGNVSKSTYEKSLDFGGEIYPELLGPENSLIRREQESDITKEYRQIAEAKSETEGKEVVALDLVLNEISNYESYIDAAQNNKNKKQTDQLKRKLIQLEKAKVELDVNEHSEHQLIFGDAYNADRNLPSLKTGQAHKDYKLPDGNIMRLRVLHPDKSESITGADIIYERHNTKTNKISIVIVQYKIWEERKLYISDDRMKNQISRMKSFICDNGICKDGHDVNDYRFPCCSGFLRPTDKLQKADQKLISTGEHLPICKIEEYKSIGSRGGELIEYENIKDISLSAELFEYLFNRGKIGSRELEAEELKVLYENANIANPKDTVVIYAQEF